MSKQSAIWVLIGFAFAAAAVALWGFSDIFKWLRAMSECSDRVEIDTSSFWFIGIASLASLPFFALLQAPRAQKVLLVALVLWFIAAPITVHRYFVWTADVHGYNLPPEYSLFKLEREVLSNRSCAPDPN